MSESPKHRDAELILRLYELRREEKMRAGREWYMRKFFPRSLDDIKATLDPANPENAYYRMVTTYWDMAASFVTHGALDAELFLESSNEMVLVWAKIEEFVPAMRKEYGISNYLHNIEELINQSPTALDRLNYFRQQIPVWRERMAQPEKK